MMKSILAISILLISFSSLLISVLLWTQKKRLPLAFVLMLLSLGTSIYLFTAELIIWDTLQLPSIPDREQFGYLAMYWCFSFGLAFLWSGIKKKSRGLKIFSLFPLGGLLLLLAPVIQLPEPGPFEKQILHAALLISAFLAIRFGVRGLARSFSNQARPQQGLFWLLLGIGLAFVSRLTYFDYDNAWRWGGMEEMSTEMPWTLWGLFVTFSLAFAFFSAARLLKRNREMGRPLTFYAGSAFWGVCFVLLLLIVLPPIPWSKIDTGTSTSISELIETPKGKKEEKIQADSTFILEVDEDNFLLTPDVELLDIIKDFDFEVIYPGFEGLQERDKLIRQLVTPSFFSKKKKFPELGEKDTTQEVISKALRLDKLQSLIVHVPQHQIKSFKSQLKTLDHMVDRLTPAGLLVQEEPENYPTVPAFTDANCILDNDLICQHINPGWTSWMQYYQDAGIQLRELYQQKAEEIIAEADPYWFAQAECLEYLHFAVQLSVYKALMDSLGREIQKPMIYFIEADTNGVEKRHSHARNVLYSSLQNPFLKVAGIDDFVGFELINPYSTTNEPSLDRNKIAGEILKIAERNQKSGTPSIFSFSMNSKDPLPVSYRRQNDFLWKTIKSVTASGSIVTVSAGNHGKYNNAAEYDLAMHKSVLVVCGIDQSLGAASFSNHYEGERMGAVYAAPAQGLCPSSVKDCEIKGTSFATPQVAMLIGTMMAIDTSLNNREEVMELLQNSGINSGEQRIGQILIFGYILEKVINKTLGLEMEDRTCSGE